MYGNTGDEPPRNGAFMPPAVTQRGADLPGARGNEPLAPPFVSGPKQPPRDEEAMPWESMAEEDEGVVEPMFAADSADVLAELTQQAKKEDFPLDAFIIPEQTQRVPSGLEGKPLPAQPSHTPLTNLADRLEKLSHRLRVENTEVVVHRLAGGDRLDALLAGLLAGYLAGTSAQ